MSPTITISNGRPERKDVTERIEAWKRRQAEEDKQKAEALRASKREKSRVGD